MYWWCADDALMMRWWCDDDALMMQWWGTDDALTLPWWCLDVALMIPWWCTYDAVVLYWWCNDDALRTLWGCTEYDMMRIGHVSDLHWRFYGGRINGNKTWRRPTTTTTDDDDRVNIGQSASGRWTGRVLQKVFSFILLPFIIIIDPGHPFLSFLQNSASPSSSGRLLYIHPVVVVVGRLSSRFVTINSTSIKPFMKVRYLTYILYIWGKFMILTTPWHILTMRKTHTNTNTKTKCLKDPTYTIFSKKQGMQGFWKNILPRIIPLKNIPPRNIPPRNVLPRKIPPRNILTEQNSAEKYSNQKSLIEKYFTEKYFAETSSLQTSDPEFCIIYCV